MKRYLFLVFIFITITKAQSQVVIDSYRDANEMKNSTLYVVMNTESKDFRKINQEYIDVFKKYWTLGPVEIIEPREMLEHVDNKSFYMIPYIIYPARHPKFAKNYVLDFKFSLRIIRPSADFINYVNSNPENINNYRSQRTTDVVSIILRANFHRKFKMDSIFENDFMGKSYMLNYGPGILKNYLQEIQNTISNEIKKDPLDSYFKADELSKLKTSTLYIPDVYVRNNSFRKDTSIINEFYHYNYKLISIDDLNDLIIESDEPVYYLSSYLHPRNAAGVRDKINITNSYTGEIIYSDNVGTLFNLYFSTRLLIRLTREIEKGSIMKTNLH